MADLVRSVTKRIRTRMLELLEVEGGNLAGNPRRHPPRAMSAETVANAKNCCTKMRLGIIEGWLRRIHL